MTDYRKWAIATGYHDAMGGWHDVPEAVLRAVAEAMGIDPDDDAEPPAWPGPLVIRPDGALPEGLLRLEDGTTVAVGAGDPRPPLPLGYHRLEQPDGRARRVVVSPGNCPPPAGRQWGWAAQLYAARSARSWGMGDLGDLATLGDWSTAQGAGFALINPLHAATPGHPQEASPYFPSSRCFANPLYLRIEDVPGAGRLPGFEEMAARGRALSVAPHIDRDAVWDLKSAALEALFAQFQGDEAFDRYRGERGPFLEGFATWCALAERHGMPWQAWPSELRHPAAPAVARFAASADGRRRIAFHAWLQWQFDRQLAAAGGHIDVVQDLAIGVNPGGADGWWAQDELAHGIRVGAPADEFNTQGQDWGLPPFDPRRLAVADYEPFIQVIRAALRHGAGVRIDHVMGLFRLFWIPTGATAAEGTYVHYPYRDLLDIVALEATRARAYVVGEDLGTVEPWVRDELAGRGVLSYRLWWFEPDRPPTWPAQALGAVTTHDLPTVAGVWSGTDIAEQRRLGLQPNEEGAAGLRRRLGEWTGSADGDRPETVVARTYGALSEAPCVLLTATLDDAAAVTERPNFPGTVDEWPNWRLALPLGLEQLLSGPLAGQVAATLSRTHRREPPGEAEL